MKVKKELKRKAHTLQPAMQIGKNGLTEGTINEINRQLKIKKTIKIKFLKSYPINEGRLNEILVPTKAILVSQIGNTVVLHKD
jgi:RNA-binding protein